MKRKALGLRNREGKKLKPDSHWSIPPNLEHEPEIIKQFLQVADKSWQIIVEEVWLEIQYPLLKHFCLEISRYIPDAYKEMRPLVADFMTIRKLLSPEHKNLFQHFVVMFKGYFVERLTYKKKIYEESCLSYPITVTSSMPYIKSLIGCKIGLLCLGYRRRDTEAILREVRADSVLVELDDRSLVELSMFVYLSFWKNTHENARMLMEQSLINHVDVNNKYDVSLAKLTELSFQKSILDKTYGMNVEFIKPDYPRGKCLVPEKERRQELENLNDCIDVLIQSEICLLTDITSIRIHPDLDSSSFLYAGKSVLFDDVPDNISLSSFVMRSTSMSPVLIELVVSYLTHVGIYDVKYDEKPGLFKWRRELILC